MKYITMKKLILLIVCGVWLSVLGLAAAQNNQVAQNNQKEEKEVLAVLNIGTQAFVKKDLAAIAKVYHEDLTYGHTSGRLQTKDEVLKDVANPQRIWESWKLSEPKVRIYGSTAVVRCISDVVNGAPGKADRSYTRYLWVLLKGPQGWQIVAGQRVAIPPPST